MPKTHHYHRETAAKHFDSVFYRTTNPDIAAAGIDPLDHFLQHGYREGRNPNAGFDVAYYLAANPDVAENGINPLVHYILSGEREGRLPRRPLHEARRVLEACVPVREKARAWAHAADHALPMPKAALEAALQGLAGRAGVVLSVSHDDYVYSCGGVQLLIADEQRAFAAGGWSMLHCSPAAPVPMLADPLPADACRIRLRLDGTALGVARMQDLCDVIGAWRDRLQCLNMVIHHLMGHAPETLSDLVACVGHRPLVWIHDHFTLCPSYALMRNDVQFCHAPPAGSNACRICVYGPDRPAHRARVEVFFARTRPFVVAPSRSALDFWRARAGLPHAGAAVLAPARLLLHTATPEETGGPLRIAHAGARLFHKGWHVFVDLAQAFARDARYAFIHLGLDEGPALPGCIAHVPVRVTPEDRHAMVEAVAEHRIDVVVNFALWPETFCFAVHEALAGGAFVIARRAAGNVWPAVQQNAPGRGCAVDDEAGLHALLASGAIIESVGRSSRCRGALLLGGNSADWFGCGAAAPGAPVAVTHG
jgi:hypothetical protein